MSNLNLKEYLSFYLKNEDDYNVFVDLLNYLFVDIKSVVDTMDSLTDVDNCPDIFLPKLGALVDYNFDYKIPYDVQREIIKRMVWLYKQKGKDYDIVQAATHGDNPKWVGSTLFLPDAILSEYTAQVIHPTDELFRHDISEHSGTHKFLDSTRYRDGVIIVKVFNFNKQIRDAVYKVVPAGIKIFFDVLDKINMSSMGEYIPFEDYEIDYWLNLHDTIRSATFDGSIKEYPFIRSANRLLTEDYELERYFDATMLPLSLNPNGINNNIDYILDTIDPIRRWRGHSILSVNDTLSDKGLYSGIRDGEIGNIVEIDEIVPNDIWYPVSAVLNLKPNGFLKFYNTEVQIDILRDTGEPIQPDPFDPINPPEPIERFFHRAIRSDNAYRSMSALIDGLLTGTIPPLPLKPQKRWIALRDINAKRSRQAAISGNLVITRPKPGEIVAIYAGITSANAEQSRFSTRSGDLLINKPPKPDDKPISKTDPRLLPDTKGKAKRDANAKRSRSKSMDGLLVPIIRSPLVALLHSKKSVFSKNATFNGERAIYVVPRPKPGEVVDIYPAISSINAERSRFASFSGDSIANKEQIAASKPVPIPEPKPGSTFDVNARYSDNTTVITGELVPIEPTPAVPAIHNDKLKHSTHSIMSDEYKEFKTEEVYAGELDKDANLSKLSARDGKKNK